MNDIDERIGIELTRLAPPVDEALAWERIQGAVQVRRRQRTFRMVAASAVAAGVVLLAIVVAPSLLRLADGPVVGEGNDPTVLRAHAEVLTMTSDPRVPGTLIAVNPSTGEERVIADRLTDVQGARWSGDGRWVAYQSEDSLWVVDATSTPRKILDGLLVDHLLWSWSWTGSRLALVHESSLLVIDASTGQVTELASTAGTATDPLKSGGDITSGESVTSPPAWSPDGSAIVFGARGGSIHAVDTTTGEMSLLVQLPGSSLDPVDGLAWSPDGSRLGILKDGGLWTSLYVVEVDGSNLDLLEDREKISGSTRAFAWSPDGSQIAFTVSEHDGLHLLVAPVAASAPVIERLVHVFDRGLAAGYLSVPAWSPDGSLIAVGERFASLRSTDSPFVVQADGSSDVARVLDDLTYESWRGGNVDACYSEHYDATC